MSLQPEKPRASHGKNLALAVTTLAVILLILVSLQLIPHSITVDKTPTLGVKVGSTIDWQGLAWGETRKLASDSKGTIYLAYRTQVLGMVGDKVFVEFSTDNGLTWSHLGGGPIDTMTPGTQMQRVPAISVGGNDVVQVVWNEVPNDQSGDRQIWYSRWIAGNSQSLAGYWSTPRNIPVYINGYGPAIPDPKHWQEHPDILVDGLNSSRVYVVWEGTDPTNFPGGNCSSSNCNTPMFTESEDGGVHWSNYTKVVPPNGEVHSRPAIIEDSNGVLYIAWYATNQTVERNAQIGWVSSTDHGKTWSQPQLIPETYGIDQRDPSLAADSHGKVYMVWKEKDPSSPQNQTMYSVLSGGSWSKPVRVNPDGQNQLNPTVQVDNATNVYVGWHTGGPYQWGGDPPGAYNGAQIWLAKFNGTWTARQLTSSATNRFINLPANPMQSPSVQIAWVEGDSPHPYNIEFATLRF